MSTGKKWLFRILKVLGVFVALYFIIALFMPGEYKVERTKEMTASSEVIFEQVSMFGNWEQWSPWAEKDPSATYSIAGEDGTVGAVQSWVGDPEISGTGSLTVTDIVANEKFMYDLKFDNWDMTSHGGVEFVQNEENVTVTWTDEGNIPFMMRPMMLLMDMDEMVGGMFARGLEKMDSIATIVQAEKDAAKYVISEIDFPESNYYGIRKEIKIDELDSTFYGINYGKLGAFVGMNQVEMSGMPVSIAFEWNQADNSAILMPAFPVSELSVDGADEVEAYTIPMGKALVIDYYGEYHESGPAHEQMEAYIAKNGLSHSIVMEEFVTDPTSVESMDEVLTKIYYILN